MFSFRSADCDINITIHLPINDGKFTVALLQDWGIATTLCIKILLKILKERNVDSKTKPVQYRKKRFLN